MISQNTESDIKLDIEDEKEIQAFIAKEEALVNEQERQAKQEQ